MVFEYGDIGEQFFVVIKGIVEVLIKNPAIKKWDIVRNDYEKLLKWKKNDFGPRE